MQCKQHIFMQLKISHVRVFSLKSTCARKIMHMLLNRINISLDAALDEFFKS